MLRIGLSSPAFASPAARKPPMRQPPAFGGGPVSPPSRFLGPPVHQGGGGPQFLGPPQQQMPLAHALSMVGPTPPPFAPGGAPVESLLAQLLAALQVHF